MITHVRVSHMIADVCLPRYRSSVQVVTVHKHGIIRLFASPDAAADDYVEVLDYRAKVMSDGDHGLLSLAWHPNFAKGTKQAFITYSGNPRDVKVSGSQFAQACSV